MADIDDAVAKVSAKVGARLGGDAALSAGKAMAQRALDDLTLTPEEKARREAESARKRRNLKIKLAIGGVVGVVVLLSAMSVLAALWKYALLLLFVAGVGGAGYWFARPKIAALKQKATARLEARKLEERATAEAEARVAAEKAAADAAAKKKQKLEDDLAALKQKAQS